MKSVKDVVFMNLYVPPFGLEEDASLLLHHVEDHLGVCVLDVLHRAEAFDERVELPRVLQSDDDDRVPFPRDVIDMRDAVVLRNPSLDLEQLALVDLHADDREGVIAESGPVQAG